MKKVIGFFIKFPIWANALIVFTLLIGLFSLSNLKQSFFPETRPLNITVSVFMPGASPEEMEEGITIKIEEALKGIVGIDEITSTTSENRTNVNIKIEDFANIDEVLTDVKNAVDRINSFPSSAEKPIVFKQRPVDRAVFIALSGEVDLLTLKKTAQFIEDDFLASGLISQVSLSGFSDFEISVEINEETLLRYNLRMDDLVNAIRLNNRDISAGSIKAIEEELLIRSRAKRLKAVEIEEIVLRSDTDGSKILVRDVATVKEQFADVPNKSFFNGERSVTINVQKLPEEDLQKISEYLEKYVQEFNDQNNQLKLSVTFDFFTLLQARIRMLTKNGLLGLGLVLLTLGIFLSLRLSFWVAAGIPLSFLGMFIFGNVIGITINMISLFGMILVVGILVDDGIVIAENIYSHFEKGKSAAQAALDGTMEVLPAVFTSVMTTIVAFTILLKIEGFDFIREVGIVVIASLTFSLFEAFFVLPAHLAGDRVLKRRNKESRIQRFRKRIEKMLDFVRFKVYGRALNSLTGSYRFVYLFIPLAFIMIISGMQKGGIIRSTFFPTIQFDDFSVSLAFKPGEREGKTESYLREFEKKIWAVRQDFIDATGDTVIKHMIMNVGVADQLGESGSHAGNVNVSLDIEGKSISSFQIIDSVRKKIGPVPDAEKFAIGGRSRFGKPVSVELAGKNIEELDAATEFLQESLRNIPSLKDVTNNSSIGKRELQITLKPKAHFLGLTHNDITRQIRQGFFGEEVQRLQIGQDEVRIWVRFPEEDRLSLGQLEAMKIKLPLGAEYPLNELVEYQIKRGVESIKRFNLARQVRIDADLENPNEPVPPILQTIREKIIPQLYARFPGVKADFGGQQRRSSQATGSMMQNGIIAIFVITLLITLNFRSLPQAFVILLIVPIGVYCAILGHGIEGIPFSILSMYGVLALGGVIINDAVVFLDKYNRNLKNGMPVRDAVIDAGIMRFRPIILTSITTVVGLYPLIRESDFQAQFLIPMAVSIAYGVLFGTLFILFFFPVIIMVVNDVRRLLAWLWTGKKPSREEVEPAIREKIKIEKNNLDTSV